jgi:hypothetical protein
MSDPSPASDAEPVGRVAAGFARWMARASRTRAHAALTLALAVLVALAAGFYGAGIRVDTDLKALLPATAPSVAALDELERRKGNTDLLTIAVEEPDAAARQQMIDALAAEVSGWPETQAVFRGRDFTALRDRSLYFLELEDLRRLRDTLVEERRRAVARAIRPGLSDGPGPDPDALLAGEDWDLTGEDGGEDEPPAPPEPPPSGSPTGEDFDLRAWLDEQKAALVARGVLSPREVEVIWLDENEQGELVWEDRVLDPFIDDAGEVQLVKAQLSVPPTDVQFAHALTTRVQDVVERTQAEGIASTARVEVVSAYNVSRQLDTIVQDASRATLLSVTLVVLVLVGGFLRARALALVVLPMAVATGLTLAVARGLYGELNALTVFLFAVLFGMGVDFAVHLYALRRSRGAQRDWETVIAGHLRPLASSMLTTVGSLFVLSLAEFKAFREFGLVSGIGVALSFLAAVLLVPAIDRLLGPDRAPRRAPAAASPLQLRPDEPRTWKAVRLLAIAGLAGVAVTGAGRVEFEKDVRNLKVKQDSGQSIAYGSAAGRCTKTLVLVADRPEDLDAAVAALEAERDAAALLPDGVPEPGKGLEPWVRGVYSVATTMPRDQETKQALGREIAEQANAFLLELPDRDEKARRWQSHLEALERLALASPLQVAELPDWAVEPFTERDGRSDRLGHVCLRINNEHLDELVAVKARLDEIVGVHGVAFADSRLVFADLIGDIERDSRRLPILALGVILLFVWLDLRRPLATAACFGALLLGLGVTLGVMGWWPIRLNFFNLVVMPAVVGLGIDASIHLWHARTRPTLDSTAHGALLAALTTVAGFAGLLVARHPGLGSIGVLGVVSVSACIGAALLALLPLRRRG